MTKETLYKAMILKEAIRELDSFLITLRNVREIEINQKYKKTIFKTIPCGYWKEVTYVAPDFIKEKIYSTLELELERMRKELSDL